MSSAIGLPSGYSPSLEGYQSSHAGMPGMLSLPQQQPAFRDIQIDRSPLEFARATDPRLADVQAQPQQLDTDIPNVDPQAVGGGNMPDQPGDGGGGLGLMGTLGIINMGMGIGRQIYDALQPGPPKPTRMAGGGRRSGNPFASKF